MDTDMTDQIESNTASNRTETDETTLREELGLFGLSGTEVDTYLAVLNVGEATTSTVAEESGVTRRAVYDVVERLEDRGLVRVNDHASPTTVRARPPTEAISNLSRRLESIAPALEERFTQTQPQTPEIQMVKSRRTALKRMREALSGARHEVLVAIPESVYPAVEAELRAAAEDDVFVLLLLGDFEGDSNGAKEYAASADVVRWWDESLPFLYAVDSETAMIGSPDLLSGPRDTEDAVSVSQEHLVGAVLGLYLSGYWPAAADLETTDPRSLPAAFDWFRQAVFHAMRHRQAGTDLRADVETEAGVRVSGPVVDVRQAFVEPTTNDYTLEMSLVVETDDGTVSVGGPGSFIEDYRATGVVLEAR